MAHDRCWFIRQGSDVQGPFRLDSVQSWIRDGRVREEMELSPEGDRWVPAEPGFEAGCISVELSP